MEHAFKYHMDDPAVILEEAPPDKELEQWIKDNKAKFKEKYGEKGEGILYATAWKRYNSKKEGKKTKKESLDYEIQKLLSEATLTNITTQKDAEAILLRSKIDWSWTEPEKVAGAGVVIFFDDEGHEKAMWNGKDKELVIL